MKKLVTAVMFLALMATRVHAQINAGEQAPEKSLPFTMTPVATFNLSWRIAFLPDGRMLITEKVGPLWLVTQPVSYTHLDVYKRQTTIGWLPRMGLLCSAFTRGTLTWMWPFRWLTGTSCWCMRAITPW